ncbi:MAG: hypothetical protein WCI02_11040 [Planctomycetota bacterium]
MADSDPRESELTYAAERPRVASSKQGPRAEVQGASAAISALSRVFAVLGILFLLGFLGSIIDRWLSTRFATVIGIVLGMILAVIGMIYAVKIAEVEARQAREANRGETAQDGSETGVGRNGSSEIHSDSLDVLNGPPRNDES